MILGDANAANSGGRTTLDDVFRRAALRRPDAIALVDPPNREDFTGGAPRRLTYAAADRMISAIAGRLRRIGLSTDAVIGVQLPNTVESVLTLLAILRAGMIAAPLPLLWRRADCIAALSRIGAKALIVAGRIGDTDHCQLAMQVAAEIFPIRYVCGFGAKLADGVIPFDDLFTLETLDPLPRLERERKGNPAAHVAVVTFDATADGLIAVPRNHVELLAGGLAIVLESRIAQDAVMVATPTLTSFAGIALALLPWLFSGGTLVLHQPFDPKILAGQIAEQPCDIAVMPGPLAQRLAEAGVLAGTKTLLAIWRSPERLATSAPWRMPGTALIDVPVFGEIGLLAIHRGPGGRPAPIPLGPVFAPRNGASSVQVAEIVRSEAGTVALRGPMVPRHPFPPGAERSGAPYLKTGEKGLIDTGHTCRLDAATRALVVTGPPAGIVSVGGYRFVLRELQDLVAHVEGGGTLAALPDNFTGHRLAGHAADRATLRHALTALGVNPLVVRAFREREQPGAA